MEQTEKNIIIDAQDVHYSYEEDAGEAVRGVTLQVRRGEFLCILGHNGSGKSTLAKLLNGLFIPTAGKITVCGMDTRDEEKQLDVRRSAGMVFQNPDNQLVATIVEEDVAFGPENLGVPQKELRGRVNGALAAVNMSEFARSSPHKLSGGQKQRIAIAGVLAMQPDIMIMDEPTAMLDPGGHSLAARHMGGQLLRGADHEERIRLLHPPFPAGIERQVHRLGSQHGLTGIARRHRFVAVIGSAPRRQPSGQHNQGHSKQLFHKK